MKQPTRDVGRGLIGLVLITASVLVAGAPAAADPCKDGVDCYCDRVRNSNDPLADSRLLVCEDFEAATLTQNTNVGGGAPLYGPWYDDTGYVGARGANSYWTKNYGSVDSNCAWGLSTSGVKLGTPCAFKTCFAAEWGPSDPWDGNSRACMDVIRDGEFKADASLAEPVLPDGSKGVFDGSHTMGWRVTKGRTSGIAGYASLGKTVTEVGITMALAYANNVGQSGIWKFPWKHHEWGTAPYIEFWHLGNTGVGVPPYSPFMFVTSQSACEAALSKANVSVGKTACSSVALRLGAGAPEFDQARDFPWGTWGCHQAHIKGMGTSNMSLRIWHNEKLIFEMTGFDGRVLINKSYSSFAWNTYSNSNQGLGETPTSQTTYRYEDNIHVREGAPVSCATIGYAGNGAPPPPPPPSSLEAPFLFD